MKIFVLTLALTLLMPTLAHACLNQISESNYAAWPESSATCSEDPGEVCLCYDGKDLTTQKKISHEEVLADNTVRLWYELVDDEEKVAAKLAAESAAQAAAAAKGTARAEAKAWIKSQDWSGFSALTTAQKLSRILEFIQKSKEAQE